MSGRQEHQQEKTGLQGDLGQVLVCSASVYPAAKPVWICSYSARKSFSLQEHHTWCRDPKDSPAFAQPVAWEQEGWCQIQTLSELEGELVLGALSDFQ